MQEQFVTGTTAANASTISLVDVGRYYDPTRFSHQRNSLDWLQHQTTSATLSTFVQRWNNPFGETLPILMEGDRGEAVTELQLALERWNIPLAIDSDFGRFTKAAVIRFQQQRRLKADGIVGNQTWRELFKSEGTIRLSELLFFRQALPTYKSNALEWLQSQLSRAVLTEFAKRWRNQVQ